MLLSTNGGDAKRAFAEACLANLGYEPSDTSDDEGQYMFVDHPDVQAISSQIDPQRQTIRKHLQALQ